MAPVNSETLAKGTFAFCKVPEGVERNTNGKERGEDPEVTDNHNDKHYLGRQVDIVVSEGSEVET